MIIIFCYVLTVEGPIRFMYNQETILRISSRNFCFWYNSKYVGNYIEHLVSSCVEFGGANSSHDSEYARKSFLDFTYFSFRKLPIFSLFNNDFYVLTELCCCITCNCYRNLFYRHWFPMLPGIYPESTQLFNWLSLFSINLSPTAHCSSGRVSHRQKMMFHMVMASSISFSQLEQCTLQCCS